MDIVVACCAGLDVHKKTVVACRRCLHGNGKVRKEVRTFGTMTADLLALSDWLAAAGVTQVALESTGVYWRPIWNILETRFQMLLVNARHIKQVPGRKTDVKDSEWIAELLQHGLLKGSFIPPAPQRALRELTRQRTQLMRQKATVSNRIQKVLEDANIKLASVATDVLGVSGRLMLEAIIAGQEDPEELAELAQRKLRAKIPVLKDALLGRVTEHHRFLLRLLLDEVTQLEAWIARVSERIATVLQKTAGAAVPRLVEFPASARGGEHLGEIGTNMEQFPTAARLRFVGGDGTGQQRKCGQAQERSHDQGQSMAACDAGAGGLGGQSYQGDVSSGPIPALWVGGGRNALVAVAHSILVILYYLLETPADRCLSRVGSSVPGAVGPG